MPEGVRTELPSVARTGCLPEAQRAWNHSWQSTMDMAIKHIYIYIYIQNHPGQHTMQYPRSMAGWLGSVTDHHDLLNTTRQAPVSVASPSTFTHLLQLVVGPLCAVCV